MAFLALTSAPFLDQGVVLNIMAIPQADGTVPPEIEPGANLTIRFGHCCPDMAQAEIVSRGSGRAVLVLGSQKQIPEPNGWILEPMPGKPGISVPGIVSENWVVLGAVTPGTRECKVEDLLILHAS